jgi:hypothetical protein
MQSQWCARAMPSGHGPVPAFFRRSRTNSFDYAQADSGDSAPGRALYHQTNRLERAVAATDGLVAARHHHKSSDRWIIPEKQSQDARLNGGQHLRRNQALCRKCDRHRHHP